MMNKVASRASFAIILVIALAAGMVCFLLEYANNAEDWVLFSGSPHVYSGTKLSQGLVTDRTGALMADLSDGRTYVQSESLRKAMLHWLGDRQGNVSVPFYSRYTREMVGFDLVNGVYTYGDAVGKMQLTLSADVQKVAQAAMEGKKGTVAVYNYKTGELLCAVSTPNFDPDNLPDIAGDTTGAYDGAYVNRFTQSVYIPGSIFKVVTLAAALESIPDIEDQSFSCDSVYEIGTGDVTCEYAHGEQNLQQAFTNSCNCAFAQLAELLGKEKLTRYVEQFEIVESLSIDGITTASGNFDLSDAYGELFAWSAIGQHTDQINPCRFMTFMGTIASGGSGVQPHVVSKISVGGDVTYTAEKEGTNRIMSKSTAEKLQQYLRNNVADKYGDENFPGFTVCAKTGTGEVGGGRKPNAMFAGFVMDEDFPLAFIVAIEDGGYGSQVCIPIIAPILQACQDALKNS